MEILKLPSRDFDKYEEDLRRLLDALSPRKSWLKAGSDQLKAELFKDNSVLFVIDEAGHLIAMGQLVVLGSEDASVENVLVLPSARGMGLGKKIMQYIINYAKQKGIKTLKLTSSKDRVAAHALYKKLGFKIVGTKKKIDKNGKYLKDTCVFVLQLDTLT